MVQKIYGRRITFWRFIFPSVLQKLWTTAINFVNSNQESVDRWPLIADDSRLFISFFAHSVQDALNHLRNTTIKRSAWATENLLSTVLHVNPSKTEIHIIAICGQLSKFVYPSCLSPADFITDLIAPVPYYSPVRKLGITFDKNRTFSDHINQLAAIYAHQWP